MPDTGSSCLTSLRSDCRPRDRDHRHRKPSRARRHDITRAVKQRCRGTKISIGGLGKRFAELDPHARETLHQWSVELVFRLCSDRRQPFTYGGFDDLADLSSGIISSFLRVLQTRSYVAERGRHVRSGTAIPGRPRTKPVYMASQAYFDCIKHNDPDTSIQFPGLS